MRTILSSSKDSVRTWQSWQVVQLERGQPCPLFLPDLPAHERCPRRSPRAIAL